MTKGWRKPTEEMRTLIKGKTKQERENEMAKAMRDEWEGLADAKRRLADKRSSAVLASSTDHNMDGTTDEDL